VAEGVGDQVLVGVGGEGYADGLVPVHDGAGGGLGAGVAGPGAASMNRGYSGITWRPEASRIPAAMRSMAWTSFSTSNPPG